MFSMVWSIYYLLLFFYMGLLKLRQACKKPYLKTERTDEKKCICPTRKKKHFQKHFHRKSSSKKLLRYFRKKDASQYRKKKHNCCFICNKRDHFARTILTSLPKLFVSYSIFNILQYYLRMKMSNQIFQNSQNKMIILPSLS